MQPYYLPVSWSERDVSRQLISRSERDVSRQLTDGGEGSDGPHIPWRGVRPAQRGWFRVTRRPAPFRSGSTIEGG